MQRKSYQIVLIIALLLISAIAIGLISFSSAVDYSVATTSFGKYTQERVLNIDGKMAEFYESGDEYYRYYHDNNGFILIKQNDNLYYAKNDNGRPVATKVSYLDAPYKIKNIAKMTRFDVDLSANSDLITSYEVSGDIVNKPLYGYYDANRPITNIVIYIMFQDEPDTIKTSLASNPHDQILNGASNSLHDYFNKMSNGEISVTSLVPMDGQMVFVYKDNNKRSYYNISGNTTQRGEREANLLTNAVNAVNTKFLDINQYNLDVNDDGFVDAVSFFISGNPADEWAGLLWPHAWNLADINKSYNKGKTAKINGKEVGAYSFNFIESINLGVLCHEFHHVLGAPDLYHYNSDFVPVGEWDLMQFNQDTPQYSLTYMRDKYTGGINPEQIQTITHNGIYSLRPVSLADNNTVLALKIPTAKSDEYFMIEYRNPQVSPTYDSLLTGAGLIVYRIKKGVAEGNKNAVYQSANYPDEVYVFRPRVQSTGRETNNTQRYANSRVDATYAYLSPDNNYFSKVGYSLADKPSVKYDYTTLFYTNGANSGICIETLSISSNSIECKISLSGGDNIDNTYFDDKIAIQQADMLNDSFSGINARIAISDIELSYLSDIKVRLLGENDRLLATNTLNIGKFHNAYNDGVRVFDCAFVVSDKGGLIGGVFKHGELDDSMIPQYVEITTVDADGDHTTTKRMAINDNGLSWQTIQNTNITFKASVSASDKITIGVKSDGTVVASGNSTTGQWAVYDKPSIIQASAGFSHTLLLNKSLQTIAVADNNFYGELSVDSWQDIQKVVAGYYASYGLTIDGNVLATGLNSHNQLNTGHWQNVVAIAASTNYVIGLTSDGRIYKAGDSSKGKLDIDDLTDIVAITAAPNFTAFLSSDNTVVVRGELSGKEQVKSWTDIVKISAGSGFLYGLTADGKVLAIGNNAQGQCNTQGFWDIIDISAGAYHGALLRKDGVVEFCGSGDSQHNSNDIAKNLIYDNYINVSRVELTLPATHILVGDTIYANAVIQPANATYKRIIYSSSDNSIASINEYGRIIAHKKGAVAITAEAHGFDISKSITLEIGEVIAPIDMFFSDTTRNVQIGKSIKLNLIFEPIDATINWSNVEYTLHSAQPSDCVEINGDIVTGIALGTATVTARYIYGEQVFQTECSIVVISDIDSINITEYPIKLIYRYGEDILADGGKLTIKAGEMSTIESITQNMLSGYNPYQLGEQSITVSYMDKKTNYTITVVDYTKEVKLDAYPVTTFIYGDSLSVDGGKLLLIKASGTTTIQNLRIDDVSGYDARKVGYSMLDINVVIDGEIFTLYYNIEVLDTVSFIRSNLSTTTYNFLSRLHMTDTIIATMSSGMEKLITLSDTEISGFVNDVLGYHDITISYFDSVNSATHTIKQQIYIKFVGNIVGDFDEPDMIFYYTTGQLPDIDIRLEIGDIIIPLSSNNNQNVWYELDNFDTNSANIYDVRLRVMVASNENSQHKREIFSRTIKVEGNGVILSIALDGASTYMYGQIPNIRLKLTLENGEVIYRTPNAINIDYDAELVDTEQRYGIKYQGKWYYKNIIIRDYATMISPIEKQIVEYGNVLRLTVYAVMATGDMRDITTNVRYSTYNTRQLGEQTVTITYTGVLGDIPPDSFVLQVVDKVIGIREKQPIKNSYLYGESFNTYSTYTLTMISGAEKDIEYNSGDFSISPYINTYIVGTTPTTITYRPLNISFIHTITVSNYCQNISVDRLSQSKYIYGELLNLRITAHFADGSKKDLERNTYTITKYDSNKLGTQTITITYQQLSTTFDITIDDEVVSLTLNKIPIKRDYSYGQALDFVGGEISIVFKSGATVKHINKDIAKLNIQYDYTRIGSQAVIIKYGDKSVSYQVTVISVANSDMLFRKDSDISIDYNRLSIRVDKPLTVVELLSRLSTISYLNPVIRDTNGIALDIQSNDFIKSNAMLYLENTQGEIIKLYRIYLAGDANMDGTFDEEDIDGLAREMLVKNPNLDIADYDNDGYYSLTDLVNWVRKAKELPQLPTNAVAKSFISDGKPIRRKDIYE